MERNELPRTEASRSGDEPRNVRPPRANANRVDGRRGPGLGSARSAACSPRRIVTGSMGGSARRSMRRARTTLSRRPRPTAPVMRATEADHAARSGSRPLASRLGRRSSEVPGQPSRSRASDGAHRGRRRARGRPSPPWSRRRSRSVIRGTWNPTGPKPCQRGSVEGRSRKAPPPRSMGPASGESAAGPSTEMAWTMSRHTPPKDPKRAGPAGMTLAAMSMPTSGEPGRGVQPQARGQAHRAGCPECLDGVHRVMRHRGRDQR